VVALFAPQAAFAAETKTRSTDGQNIQVLMSQFNEGASGQRNTATALVAGPHDGPPRNPGGLVNCPAGYHLSPFDMPVYDDAGLFVVGYETVWFCIPDDLEPAG
jgi:hypothetical protein